MIIDGVLSSDPASPLHIDSLRKCADEATLLTRDGFWPHRRVVGNAFPPFTKDNRDSWGVQHIMNPQLDTAGPSRSVPLSKMFQCFYGSSPLLEIASLLVGAEVNDMQMELFNLLINPPLTASLSAGIGTISDLTCRRAKSPYAWIRLRMVYSSTRHCMRTTVCSSCLALIAVCVHRKRPRQNNAKAPPATQVDSALPDTEQEQGFAADGSWIGIDPPNTLRVKLKPGQTAFYSQRILHRASYLPSAKRATLHGCYGDASQGGRGAAERARNVLQHGVEWMRDPAFGEALPDALKRVSGQSRRL